MEATPSQADWAGISPKVLEHGRALGHVAAPDASIKDDPMLS